MAADFIRIGGPIESAPLNTNFRKLRNDITMSNVNLKFSENDGIKDNIKKMLEIKNPENGQICYVVSNGSLYRYFKGDSQWHQIADFGQTYRQGFLNSGVVVMSNVITAEDKRTLVIPEMLVYYKTLPGDDLYLKGMYKVETQKIDIANRVAPGNTYTIILDINRKADIVSGILKDNNANVIELGTMSVDKNCNMLLDFIFTTPNIAYTAERGSFLTHRGEINGLSLDAGEDQISVSRREGVYHVEGINASIVEDIDEYVIDTSSSSNYNTRFFASQATSQLIYLYPENGLSNEIIKNNELIKNKYYNRDKHTLENLLAGQYTIQTHFITPNGLNIVLYGDEKYNSFEDAEANLNREMSLDFLLPCVEATRMVVGNEDLFDIRNPQHFRAYTVTRLAQAGTIDPQFADTSFAIYSGLKNDTAPASIRFDLEELYLEGYNKEYILKPKRYNDQDIFFSLAEKYAANDKTVTVENTTKNHNNEVDTNKGGYIIPTQRSVSLLEQRMAELEHEVWEKERKDSDNQTLALHEQGVRYRLDKGEQRITKAESDISTFNKNVTELLNTKVHKETTINGQALGDDLTNPTEKKTVTLYTCDITEGSREGKDANLWYTQDRVEKVPMVATAYEHSQIIEANPHKSSTDDIIEKDGTDLTFLRTEQKNRISSTKLPEDTKAELAKKMEGLGIKTIVGNKQQAQAGAVVDWGQVQTLRLYTDGISLEVDAANKMATLECIGQADPSDFLKKTQYATEALKDSKLIGYVDKALVAKDIESLADLKGQQTKYYGTNDDGVIGTYDLPVTTGDVKGAVNVEDVVFEPYKHSITLKHLADASVVYTNNNEESTLNTNVYDLVKHHYHKVYNSGVQEEYDSSGKIIIHDPYYNYTTPFGGLSERAYYFTHANVCYTFTPEAFIPANTELRFYPNTTYLVYVNNEVETEIKCADINGDLVETDYLLHFVSSTDWNCINEWNFGDNLTVSVVNGRATINAKDVSAGGFTNSFSNLADVNVDYDDTNVGKLLMLAKDANNNYMIRLQEVALQEFMTTENFINDYVSDSINHIVNHAALADVSNDANLLQGVYTVDNSKQDDTHLWTANKTITYINRYVEDTTPEVHYGTGVPTSATGKPGDIYILLED